MPRPCKIRSICCNPESTSFKPCGMPRRNLETITLTLDELEAIRLADLEGLYQEEAAQRMNVSRQTFGNIISAAHLKVADFIINSRNLLIEGGNVMKNERSFTCSECKHTWSIPFGTGKPEECPKCKSNNLHRSEDERGGRRRGQVRGKGCCRRGAR